MIDSGLRRRVVGAGDSLSGSKVLTRRVEETGNIGFGSTMLVRDPSESGRPSGGNPTLGLGGRLSASLRAFERFGLSACFVP